MSEAVPNHPQATRAQTGTSWRLRPGGLQFKACLLAAVSFVTVAGIGVTLFNHAMCQIFYESEYARTREWAASLATSSAIAVESHDTETLTKTVEDLVETHSAAYVAFADTSGNVLSSGEIHPDLLDSVLERNGTSLRVELLQQPHLIWFRGPGIACADILIPIYASREIQALGTRSRAIVGYLRFASDVTNTKTQLEKVTTRVTQMGLGIVLLALPCTLLLTRYIVSPIRELAQTARAITRGATDARSKVRSEDEVGELAVAFNTMADRLTESRLELLELNAELEERVQQRTRELEELASRDPLTGLYNRRHFSEVITREFAAAERYDADLTCLMFDLDRFKETNDLFGHRTGDEVIIVMARAMLGELRASDVGARFGGDEFIILLPQTSASAASMLVERITERFNAEVRQRFPDVPVGVSIGVASLRTTRSPSAEALIHEADLALYAAKEAGRSQSRHTSTSVR